MSNKPLSIAELRDRINRNEMVDPLVTLEAITNGQDPRQISKLYDMVMDIEEMNRPDDDINRGDWDELMDFILKHGKHDTVQIKQTLLAAKTLAEYVHPKVKNSDIVGNDGVINSVSLPLTDDEVRTFKQVFNDEF